MTYAYPTNVTSVTGFVEYTDAVTNYALMPGVLIAFFAIIILTTRKSTIEVRMVSASFATFLLTLLLVFANIVDGALIVVPVVLSVLSALLVTFRGEK